MQKYKEKYKNNRIRNTRIQYKNTQIEYKNTYNARTQESRDTKYKKYKKYMNAEEIQYKNTRILNSKNTLKNM